MARMTLKMVASAGNTVIHDDDDDNDNDDDDDEDEGDGDGDDDEDGELLGGQCTSARHRTSSSSLATSLPL